jgi:hypothetical protein
LTSSQGQETFDRQSTEAAPKKSGSLLRVSPATNSHPVSGDNLEADLSKLDISGLDRLGECDDFLDLFTSREVLRELHNDSPDHGLLSFNDASFNDDSIGLPGMLRELDSSAIPPTNPPLLNYRATDDNKGSSKSGGMLEILRG